MDLTELLIALIVIGLIMYLILYVVLPLIPLPAPFRTAIVAVLWVIVAIYFIRFLIPLLPHVRI